METENFVSQTPEETELKQFLEAVYAHSQTLVHSFRVCISKLQKSVYNEPTWEELYEQKTLYHCQREVGIVLDEISNLTTRLNYLRAEYKRTKLEFPTVNFPHKYTYHRDIEDYLDALKDYEKSLKALEVQWERRYHRVKTVSFMQNSERYKNI